ncbi:MAG TPA: hypothetical protein VKB92_11395, partial [Myxococcales bacterium]|nr:hypothetical protein [Myxococcales bacterium]
GALGQVRLAADADYFKAQREAEAILAEKRAKAKGIEKQNAAMSGAGGRTMVKLRLAEALEGKQILFIPSGAKGGALQTMNVNELISRYAAARVEEDRGRSTQPAVERQK